jgi:hypothetical protein
MKTLSTLARVALLVCLAIPNLLGRDWAVYEGKTGPGQGKHIVFLSGDEEYRSEEALPMLARILAERHGFKCTVLFAVNPATGLLDSVVRTNIPGMAALDSADLCVMLLRFRELPDAQMKHFVDYLDSGKPIVGLRTSTHAFSYDNPKASAYARFDWRSKEWPGGFGQQVLGDTWVNHHGDHGKESTRAVIADGQAGHPILRGVTDVWVPTDVYGLAHLPADVTVLMRGQVVAGMNPSDPALEGAKNTPMVPVAWVRDYKGASGKTSKIFTSTMGSGVDFKNEGLRRLVVNACYWAVGLSEKIPARSNVDIVGTYEPTYFGFGKHRPGIKPSDL